MLLITHELDIAEYGTRLVRFRDGRIQSDHAIMTRRDAATELAALPPVDDESGIAPPKSGAVEYHAGVA